MSHALGSLTRETLAARTLYRVASGRRLRPDVLVADRGDGPVVVKDWAPRSRAVRALLAPVALRREARAHGRLEGLACVPRLLGRLDAWAIVLEYRPGTRISHGRPWLFDAGFARALAACVAQIHARGVVHLDLAHRSNLGVDLQGRPLVFDFGAAACPGRPGPLARALLHALALADLRALRKWRRRLAAPAR